VAQRRKRVFVVASARKGFNPAEILFEFDSLRRDSAPSREARQGITADAQSGAWWDGGQVAATLTVEGAGGNQRMPDKGNLGAVIVPAICFEPRSPDGHARVVGDIAPCLNTMGGGQREPCVTYGMQSTVIGRSETSGPQGMGFCEEVSYTLTKADQHGVVAIQDVRDVDKAQNGRGWNDDGVAYTIDTHATQGVVHEVATQYAVRRLTPIECERLQGFPDNYTNTPWRKKPESPDGPRYKALGNSWAVPVVRWIGERIRNAVN
jgi:DNA (cytosine-5)-methyltransferase 1